MGSFGYRTHRTDVPPSPPQGRDLYLKPVSIQTRWQFTKAIGKWQRQSPWSVAKRPGKSQKVPESPRKSPKVHLKGYRYFLSTFYKNSSMARRKVKKETNDAQDAPITTTKKQAVCRCRRCTRRQRHRHFSRCFELGSITNLVASPSRRNSDGMYDCQAR